MSHSFAAGIVNKETDKQLSRIGGKNKAWTTAELVVMIPKRLYGKINIMKCIFIVNPKLTLV